GEVYAVIGTQCCCAIADGILGIVGAHKANEVGLQCGFGGANGDEKAGIGLGAAVDGEVDVVEHAGNVQIAGAVNRSVIKGVVLPAGVEHEHVVGTYAQVKIHVFKASVVEDGAVETTVA